MAPKPEAKGSSGWKHVSMSNVQTNALQSGVVSLEVGTYEDFLREAINDGFTPGNKHHAPPADEKSTDSDHPSSPSSKNSLHDAEDSSHTSNYSDESPDTAPGKTRIYNQSLLSKILGDGALDASHDTRPWDHLGLHPVLSKYLVLHGFTTPTYVQTVAIRPAGRNKSLVVVAETGSGKTLSYLLPALSKAIKLILAQCSSAQPSAVEASSGRMPELTPFEKRSVQTVIVTPTRELALQVYASFVSIFGDLQKCFKIMAPLVGGISLQKQERLLRDRPLIIVGTPGRLDDLFKSNEYLGCTDALDRVIIDESDKMLERGRFSELVDLCILLTSSPTAPRVTIASATLNLPSILRDRDIKFSDPNKKRSAKLTASLIPEKKKGLTLDGASDASSDKKQQNKKTDSSMATQWLSVLNNLGFSDSVLTITDVSPQSVINASVLEKWMHCSSLKEKDEVLAYLVLRYRAPTLVFVRTIKQAKLLAGALQLLGVPAWGVHASMPQRQRLKNVDRLRNLEDAVIVTTDVCARGIDIPKVALVIQHSAPESASSHVHRIGRASRVQSEGAGPSMLSSKPGKNRYNGVAVSLISPQDEERFEQIMRMCGRTRKTAPASLSLNDEVLSGVRRVWQAAILASEAETNHREFLRKLSWLGQERQSIEEDDSPSKARDNKPKKHLETPLDDEEYSESDEEAALLKICSSKPKGKPAKDTPQDLINTFNKEDRENLQQKLKELTSLAAQTRADLRDQLGLPLVRSKAGSIVIERQKITASRNVSIKNMQDEIVEVPRNLVLPQRFLPGSSKGILKGHNPAGTLATDSEDEFPDVQMVRRKDTESKQKHTSIVKVTDTPTSPLDNVSLKVSEREHHSKIVKPSREKRNCSTRKLKN